MRHVLLTAVIATLMSGVALAETQPAPSEPPPFFQEASDCAAAFESRVVERKAQPRSDARNQLLRADTELGFAFVAAAYKQGLRNPEADQMLKAAEKRWPTLSKAEQQKRLTACTVKAQELMKGFSAFERFLVSNRAQARVDKFLRKEAGR
ncbi:MAG TPA: hypothetical protein VFM48_00700 [Aquabacterium sp.]|nr:hypothetical protein [Aquabacterium sp.]